MTPAIETAAPAPEPSALPRARWPLAGAGALALLAFVWCWAHLAPATMSADSNGYVVLARLIATQGKTQLTPESPVQFVGMHWLETSDGVFHSRYPAGLPVLLAAAYKVGGMPALVLVNPLLSAATIFLVFLLARRFTDGGPALLAAAVFACNATVQQHSLDADSHIAAAFFLTAGVLALLWFADDLAPARGLLAGFLLGMIPTVRYPEALAGVAVGAWLLWQVRPVTRVWPAVVGAALPVGALFIHNAAAYGAFWRTGYALTNEQTGFGVGYFLAHWQSYLNALGGSGFGVFFAFGAVGLAAMIADARHRAAGVLFGGIFVPLLVLYMAYYFGDGQGNLRFLVPLFPLLATAGVWLLVRVTTALGQPGRAVWAVVAVLQLLPGAVSAAQTAARMKTTLKSAAAARTALEKHAPAGSAVIVERQLGESLDATGQWKLVDEGTVNGMGGRGGMMGPGPMGGMGPGGFGGRRGPFDGLRAGGMAGGPMTGPGMRGPFDGLRAGGGGRGPNADPNQPSPQQVNKNRAQRERYEGLTPRERQARTWADIRQLAGDKPIYWYARSLDAIDNALPDDADYESITEVDAPMMMGPGGGGRGGPGGPGGGGPGMGGAMMGGGPMGGGGMGPPMMNQPGSPGMNFQPGPGGMGMPGAMAGQQQPPQKLRLVKITFAKAKVATNEPASNR